MTDSRGRPGDTRLTASLLHALHMMNVLRQLLCLCSEYQFALCLLSLSLSLFIQFSSKWLYCTNPSDNLDLFDTHANVCIWKCVHLTCTQFTKTCTYTCIYTLGQKFQDDYRVLYVFSHSVCKLFSLPQAFRHEHTVCVIRWEY